jgi:hypothetical protein
MRVQVNSGKEFGRREFLAGAAASVLSPLARASGASARGDLPKATADTCIFIWLAGGMCHLDTFDPKLKGNGENIPGSYYNPIKTAVPPKTNGNHDRRWKTSPITRSEDARYDENAPKITTLHSVYSKAGRLRTIAIVAMPT